MEIAIDARTHGSEFSGIARYSQMLLLGIARVRPEEKIAVFIKKKSSLPPALASSNAFEWVELPRKPFSLYQQMVLPKMLRRMGVRCLHSVDVHSPAWANCRRIVTIHDLIPLVCEPELQGGEKARWPGLWKMWLRWQVRNAAGVVTISEWSRRDIERELKVPTESITVIPPAIEISTLQATAPQLLRERFGLHGRVILSVGRRAPHKNLVGLIHAFAALTKLVAQSLHLVIVGNIDARYPQPEQEAAKLGIASQVVFTGSLSDEDLAGFYKLSDLLAFPSFYEGYGLPALEAMQSGLPVVASNRAALPEVVGDVGLLVDPANASQFADAMASILMNPTLAEDLRQKGFQRAARITLESQAREYLALYRKVLSGSLPHGRGSVWKLKSR